MFANVATVRRALLFLAANILLSVGWSGHLGAQPAPAKVVAITAAHTEGLSYLDANRVRTSAQMIASRLADLGALSYRADANGACETKSLSAELVDRQSFERTLRCAAKSAPSVLLVIFYSGQMSAAGEHVTLFADSSAGSGIDVSRLLNDATQGGRFTTLLVLDPFVVGSAPSPPLAARLLASDGSRIVLVGTPVGEMPEPANLFSTAFGSKFAALLDAETTSRRVGRPMRDLRALLLGSDLLESKSAWASRAREITMQRLPVEKLTFAGREPAGDDRVGEGCGIYAPNGAPRICSQLAELAARCKRPHQVAALSTALRTRCFEQLVQRKKAELAERFAEAAKAKTCTSLSEFVDRYAADADLADAPEIERAVAERIRVCAEETRNKQLALLEKDLGEALRTNECAALRQFSGQRERDLSVAQSSRLMAALNARCDIEQRAEKDLRSCLDKAEETGSFCGHEACFRSFTASMQKDVVSPVQKGERDKWEKICRASTQMTSCFASNPCGGETCSLPLRLAVGNGALIGAIQRLERDARQNCDATQANQRKIALEAERLAQQRQQEAEAEQRRREQQTKRVQKEGSTTRVTICNSAHHGKVMVALSYFDFDSRSWIVEGWWGIEQGACNYIGDQFVRGSLYYFANTAGERRVWAGDFGLCLSWSKFRRVHDKAGSCNPNMHRKFRQRSLDDREYRLNLTD